MDAPLFPIADGPAGGIAFWRTASDGLRIRLGHWPAPAGGRGTAALFPGRTEYIEKYGRVAGQLRERGFGLLTIDWRGQGLSERSPRARGAGDGSGHVEDFRDYQRDVALLAEAWADLEGERLVIAHSMGGAIAWRALREGLAVQAAAFSAPMFGLGLSGLKRAAAWGLVTLARHGSLSHRLPPGVSPLSYAMTVDFATNDLTSDLDSFVYLRRQLQTHPELALGGPTLSWLREALREIAAIRHQTPPALPALVALGSEERIVDSQAVRARTATWPSARLDLYEGARHEIMLEHPGHRARFLDAAVALLG